MHCLHDMDIRHEAIMSEIVGPESRIFVAGHNGLVGSAIVRELVNLGYRLPITRNHNELDLTNDSATQTFFGDKRPEIVILAAAVVGGINANNVKPVRFIADNLAIQTNVIRAAFNVGVKRLLFLGSSCIYPRNCPQPIKEKYLLSGPLEMTNRPFAVAKIAGVEMCWAFNREYDTKYFAVMPTNLFGPNDSFHAQYSHVLSALTKKILDAKLSGTAAVKLWGTGAPLREFLSSDDLARACLRLLSSSDADLDWLFDSLRPPLVNVGSGYEVSISDLAELVASEVGYSGDILWDATMPDGTFQKLLDSSKIRSLGWRPEVSLKEGIALVCQEYARTLTQRDG